MKAFREISAKQITQNPFELIGDDWMLVTSGTKDKFNMMTASWGGVGVLWKKDVAFVFIRPQRYTFEFIENNERMTLCFFDESKRGILNLCGSKSGRELDKVAETGLTPVITEQGIYYEEAKMVLCCKKLYAQYLDGESFIDTNIIPSCYKDNDYHKMYVCSIEKVLIQ
jgi:flavin reductase (DIM6/NTAB) family NADH-FMN oxidoreductase RutF